MRIFVAGATGAVGRRLVPMLTGAGHDVAGTTRHRERADALRVLGVEPVVLDALDPDAVIAAIREYKPDVLVHQLTALAGPANLRRFDRYFAVTNRLRTEGTDHLLAGARAAGTPRIVAQSYTGWTNPRTGSAAATEEEPLDPHPTRASRLTLTAIGYLEDTVTGAADLDGLVLRYGTLYGPGTALGVGGELVEMARRRRLPIVAAGTGVWSFVHIDDAATATMLAIEGGGAGVYNIVDDDPAPVSDWLPELAAAVEAKPPCRVPAWVARPLLGEHGTAMMTTIRGSSNHKAKRELRWEPTYPSWRIGFHTGLGYPASGPSSAAWRGDNDARGRSAGCERDHPRRS